MKHTRGPWEWEIHDHSTMTLHGPDEMRDHVLSVGPCKNCQKEGTPPFDKCMSVYQRDMPLLAAAPDLLEALKYARRLLKPDDADMNYIDEAIKKAEQ